MLDSAHPFNLCDASYSTRGVQLISRKMKYFFHMQNVFEIVNIVLLIITWGLFERRPGLFQKRPNCLVNDVQRSNPSSGGNTTHDDDHMRCSRSERHFLFVKYISCLIYYLHADLYSL